MVTKAPSLSISRLTCQIPNHKTKILEIATVKNNNPLYKNFIEKFLNYIPVDYGTINKFDLFCDFTDEAFAFFLNRNPNQLKIEINPSSLKGSPAISILIINQNMPFIVDSLTCLLARLGIQAKYILHPVISCKRSNDGSLIEIYDDIKDNNAESLVFIKVVGKFDEEAINSLKNQINETFEQVDSTYNSWQKLLDKITVLTQEIIEKKTFLAEKNLYPSEPIEFLHWLKKDNFTFLGSIDFNLNPIKLLSYEGASTSWQDNEDEIKEIINFSNSSINNEKLIILGKINRLSPVHRSNLIDYILIKKINDNGEYNSGTIIFGLYSSMIYYQSIKNIPILREKLSYVLEKCSFPSQGYNSKKLKLIIESIPREAVIQIDEGDLYCMCLHMLSSMMSKRLKLFIQRDWSESFINVLILLPKERLTPEVHNSINKYLSQKIGGNILYDYITELAQDFSHLFITIEVKEQFECEHEEIEKELIKISTLWHESFHQKLSEKLGEYQSGIEFKIFNQIFPGDYRQKFTPDEAVIDLEYLKIANSQQKIIFDFKNLSKHDFELKIYSANNKIILSNILPSIENLGFKAIDEESFFIKSAAEIKDSWIYKFTLYTSSAIERDHTTLKLNIEDALDKMTIGMLANDSLGKLVVLCGFNWRQVKLLKALTRYLHQTGFTYGKGYVQLTLIKNYKYAELLIALFEAKFNPQAHSIKETERLTTKIFAYLDTISNSSEDKVLRHMYSLINAMVRTNFYQLKNNNFKDYFSFKFNSYLVSDLPLPIPYAEIFVYSNEFEGIHLRGGKVARGGIRWSDRGEDYRTEVLGLMKAQMTKNSVIVPVGSKGGFFLLFAQDNLTREEYMQKTILCYQNFLRGLLDITDNIIEEKAIHPENTIIYDQQDPYLVVAADKGTATFSDYANSVSAEYNFWLNDAFASGGSAGYDHKEMGITAKGAWISVQHHFQSMGRDVQKDPITVVGIGDMSGDVFGNGMLRSRSIKLVAAFNHIHIFIDPNPDPEISFKERERLFNLPLSKWSDYDPTLISQGGGVFERAAKLIPISREMSILLNIEATELPPEELIKAIIKAKVDLIWNGGIGTYIKASTENNVEIGDKSNDALRCDGKTIRAKVIAEGGNLGVSQQGRIEYSRNGGRINTDFIDNSAGVDCSDHEVNIKIVLNNAVAANKLSLEERNNILSDMTKHVEELVLIDNFKQNQAISFTQLSTAFSVETFSQLINSLEEEKLLDRSVEFLPTEVELNKRAIAKEGMTRPELAILLSYSKMSLYNQLIITDIGEDDFFENYLISYFPQNMREKFKDNILSHPLKKEIITTVITNKVINQLSGAIINTIKQESGASVVDIIRAYIIVCEIFDLDILWEKVELLPPNIDYGIKIDMFTELAKIIRRGIAWLLKNIDYPHDIKQTISEFKEQAQALSQEIRNLLIGEEKIKFEERLNKYIKHEIEPSLATSIATLDSLISTFDIIYITKNANINSINNINIASLYFETGNKLSIDWLRKNCDKLVDDSYWNRLSIQSIKDDLYDKQRRLLIKIINQTDEKIEFDSWLKNNYYIIKNFIEFVVNIKLHENINLNIIILANKKLEMFLRKLG